MAALRLSCAVRTDPGPIRPGNEDAAFASARLAAVADGVGGRAAGEVASWAVIGSLQTLDKSWVDGRLEDALASAAREGNERIAFISECRPETAGMSTTLTAVALHGDYLVASVGDSRAYLYRDGVLDQITRDDSLLQELLESGAVDPEQARRHPQRNVVTAVLDGDPRFSPAVERIPARAGDRLLVCSDGVSDVLEPARLRDLLATPEPARAADAIVRAALDAGARDNVTAVVADAVEADAPVPWLRGA